MSGVTVKLGGSKATRGKFAKVALGQRGYDTACVDAFCKQLAAARAGRIALSAADVRTVQFPTASLGHRGYDRDQVDSYLDEACVELELTRLGASHPAGGPLLTSEQVRQVRFSAPPGGYAGYVADQVDDFVEQVAVTLTHAGPICLTRAEVATIDFDLAHAGCRAYHMEEVNAFLAVVVETLAGME